jgi:hypothetical protein
MSRSERDDDLEEMDAFFAEHFPDEFAKMEREVAEYKRQSVGIFAQCFRCDTLCGLVEGKYPRHSESHPNLIFQCDHCRSPFESRLWHFHPAMMRLYGGK